ncbi:MAG: hypothetical protein P4L73_01480 [Caulobacteraceae bacterium]|nr:hypothetical protein [Caulobacteraceae bacterium]
MRIRPLLLIAGLAALFAGAAAAHPPAGPSCQPHRAPRPAAHVRHCACRPQRTAVHAVRHARRARTWTEARASSQHYGYVEEHGWSGGERRWAYGRQDGAWAEAMQDRHWTTDRFGYLDWPGKTHFVDGHPVDGGALPPPPPGPPPETMGPGAMGPGSAGPGSAPPPPPPEDWQGPPPPGADDDAGYEIRRY